MRLQKNEICQDEEPAEAEGNPTGETLAAARPEAGGQSRALLLQSLGSTRDGLVAAPPP